MEYSPDENDFCFVTNWDYIVGPTIVKNQYILDRKRSGYAIEEGYQYALSVIKSYDVRVHDIHTGELLKTIDITQSLKHISDQWQLSRSGIGSIVLDGEPFVCIPMQRKPSKGEYDIDADFSKNNVGTLYVSIEDGRYFVKTYQEDYFEENLMMYGRFYKTEEEIKEYWQLAEDYINFKKIILRSIDTDILLSS